MRFPGQTSVLLAAAFLAAAPAAAQQGPAWKVQGMPAPVALPVVKMSWRSRRSAVFCAKLPGRLAQLEMSSSVLALFAAGCAPAAAPLSPLFGTVVLLDVPPVDHVGPGAIWPRAKMSYRLMPCTS